MKYGILVALLSIAMVVNTVDADDSIRERQVMEINKSLKSVIEENRKLFDQKKKLENEIERLRSAKRGAESKYAGVKRQRDQFAKNVETVKERNQRYSQEIQALEKDIKRLELAQQNYDEQSVDWDDGDEYVPSYVESVNEMDESSTRDVQRRESKTLDLLATIDAFTEDDERLRLDSAKAHYNMGNIYYQKGEYEIASREYFQAVTLMPDDPDAHYNLAFVSGEHLRDYRTALKHYQMYLYLSPDARDAHIVREKIMQIKLMLKSVVDSPLEKVRK